MRVINFAFDSVVRCSMRHALVLLAIPALLAFPGVAHAQRTLLFETFEGVTPDPPLPDVCPHFDLLPPGVSLNDACIGVESIGTYNRSTSLAGGAPVATVTGGTFPDPFDPGNNQSLVLTNPEGATTHAVNWFRQFPDDPDDPNYYLRNGVIQFDTYLEAANPNSWWTFMGIRFGFESQPEDRNQVVTTGDQTIWNNFRLSTGSLLEQQQGSPDQLYDQQNTDTFIDPDVVIGDRPMRVRYDLNGDNATYKVTITNLAEEGAEAVELIWSSGDVDQPWAEKFNFETFQVEPVPGINVISFLTDASAFDDAPGGVTAHAYIDNLLIINNDLPPSNIGDYNEDGVVGAADYTVWRDGLGTTFTQADYDVWRANFGATVGSSSTAEKAAVPEPSSIAIAIFALFVLQCIAKRNCR